MLGSYDPHTKTSTLAKDKAEFYLKNGARPSDRVIRLLQTEGVSLPGWVKQPTKNTRELRNPDKLRKNQPEKPADEVTEESTEEPSTEAEAPAEQTPEAVEAVDSTEEKTKE
jgi:small subunit ribosomal protein S16